MMCQKRGGTFDNMSSSSNEKHFFVNEDVPQEPTIIGFAFDLLDEKILPLNLFDYYFEISKYSWIMINDSQYFNSKIFNYTGKIPPAEMHSNNKFGLEIERFSHKNPPETLIADKMIKFASIHNTELFIPTSNFIKVANILDLGISYRFPILFVGPPESGKTKIIKKKLLNETDKNLVRFLQFNINYKETIDKVN